MFKSPPPTQSDCVRPPIATGTQLHSVHRGREEKGGKTVTAVAYIHLDTPAYTDNVKLYTYTLRDIARMHPHHAWNASHLRCPQVHPKMPHPGQHWQARDLRLALLLDCCRLCCEMTAGRTTEVRPVSRGTCSGADDLPCYTNRKGGHNSAETATG